MQQSGRTAYLQEIRFILCSVVRVGKFYSASRLLQGQKICGYNQYHQRTSTAGFGHCPLSCFGKEVFDAFLLLHYCQQMGKDNDGKILYQDFQTGLEQDIILDSLSPKHHGMRSPDMNEISLQGTDYKLFTYPFLLGQHRMVLCE
jgi:hypothetical protein